ncbi:DoxX family protein [Mycobacterium sp. ITM-2016-00318]|uniref:DoxX family protein n=1 Tax=Mycobacterium sp. ITM-2016-00318 TaxID=2099693 RepID=UPI000CF9C5AE|nr:DoxX family protein [Mycobacterium sp. ITM-2016-00318]WNG90913.1 DoxX family protein [Mycobacterium sp. ITM-2016-00318]
MLIRRIARPLLSVAFIGQGVDAIRNPKTAADAARPALDGMRKLPDSIGTKVPSDAENFARVNAAVQIGGGLLLATGKMPRLASAALAFTVIPGSLGGHMFWNEPDPQRKADERRAFMTDLSLLGGLIIAAVDTEGKPSLGWRGRRAARAVTAALPVGAASGGALSDSAFAEKLGHGLSAARERGAELADVARDRAPEIAEAARERAAGLAEIARERGPELAEAARGRAAELADVARERAPEFADAARGRAAGLAEVARERAPELAEAARDRAEAARDRASTFADTARTQTKQTKREAKKQRRRLS